MRDRHPSALEYRAVAQDAALDAAGLGPTPRIAPKSRRIDFRGRRSDAVLQLIQVALDRGCVCRLEFWHWSLRLLFCGPLLSLRFSLPSRGRLDGRLDGRLFVDVSLLSLGRQFYRGWGGRRIMRRRAFRRFRTHRLCLRRHLRALRALAPPL